jgi:sarcosine oxidase subunit beta
VELIPALAAAHVIRAFAGLRPWSPDALPLVGRLGDAPQVVIAAGHEGDGITLAPVTAHLVAELICEGREPDGRLAPGRFGNSPEIQRGE